MTDLRSRGGKRFIFRWDTIGCSNYLFLLCCLFISCNMKTDKQLPQAWKEEVLEAERAFAELVSKEGIHRAFVSFAAEEAVLMRNNKLVQGKKNIDVFYADQSSRNLKWAVEFVDVAASGDLAYTYGHYTFSSIDGDGNQKEDRGIFHTVWKRQKDGSWKFVYD